MKKGINRAIYGYLLEMCATVAMLVFAMIFIAKSPTPSYAQIAEGYAKNNLNTQVMFIENDYVNESLLLESGSLVLRNPNKIANDIIVNLNISKTSVSLEQLKIIINDDEIIDSIEENDDYYTMPIISDTLDRYQEKEYKFKMYLRELQSENSTFQYSFNVQEKF